MRNNIDVSSIRASEWLVHVVDAFCCMQTDYCSLPSRFL